MKIDRLIGILAILLQQEKITAPELAENLKCPGGPSTGISNIYVRPEFR